MDNFIDVHTHIFNQETLEQYLRKTGAWSGKVLSLQYWAYNAQPRYPLWNLLTFAGDTPKIEIVAAVNIYFDIEAQVAQLALYTGCIVGVKMYPGYQPFYPSEERIDAVAEFCTKYQLPLIFHSGDCSARGTPLLKYAHPLHIDELAVRHPDLKIVIAHLGFPWLMDASTVLHKNKNVYADLSGVIDKQESGARQRLVRRYADDLNRVLDYFPDIASKLMFGTDFSGDSTHLCEVEPYFEVVNKVFEGAIRRCVYHDTAQKVFFLKPAP